MAFKVLLRRLTLKKDFNSNASGLLNFSNSSQNVIKTLLNNFKIIPIHKDGDFIRLL